MNARTYDPVIGRFTSPDSLVEDYFKSQILNRYSYVGNNPLSFTDPTGQCFLGCFWKSPIFKAVVVVAAIITFNYEVLPALANFQTFAALTQSLNVGQLMALAAAEGAVSGAVLSGNLSGAWQGAVSGALFAGVGSLTAGWSAAGASTLEEAGNVAIHGVAGGVSSVIRGGKFQSGFLSAGLSEFAGPQINKFQLDFVGNAVAHSIVGGAGSVLGGGKFENGAITGAFGYMFNDWQHRLMAQSTGAAVGGVVGGAITSGTCVVATSGACMVAAGPAAAAGVAGGAAVGAATGGWIYDVWDELQSIVYKVRYPGIPTPENTGGIYVPPKTGMDKRLHRPTVEGMGILIKKEMCGSRLVLAEEPMAALTGMFRSREGSMIMFIQVVS